MGNSVISASEFLIILSQTEVGHGPVGLKFQRLLVFCDRLIDLLVMVVIDGHIEMFLCCLGIGDVECRLGSLHLDEPFRILSIRDALIIASGRFCDRTPVWSRGLRRSLALRVRR